MNYATEFHEYVAAGRTRWDEFRTFHVPDANHAADRRGGYRSSAFVRFEDESLAILRGGFDPRDRRYYAQLNIEIWSTTDTLNDGRRKLTMTDPDGAPLTHAALHRSTKHLTDAKTLVLDWDLMRGYLLAPLDPAETPLPSYLRQGLGRAGPISCAAGYYPAPLHAPVTNPIRITEPFKFTPEQREHVNDIMAAAKMWAVQKEIDIEILGSIFYCESLFRDRVLDSGNLNLNDEFALYPQSRRYKSKPLIAQHFQPEHILEKTFPTMTDMDRVRLLRNGIYYPRVERHIPYVNFQVEYL